MSKADYLTKVGAEALTRRIREFWLERGVRVRVWYEKQEGFGEGEIYVVRSNLFWTVPS
jgi:hypothetical protein